LFFQFYISLFYQLTKPIIRFALFAEVIADKLFKKGSSSSLKEHLKNLLVEKSTVRYQGIITNNTTNEPPIPPIVGKQGRTNTASPKASIPEVMQDLRKIFQISDEEAILINEVIEFILKDETVVSKIINNLQNILFLTNYRTTLKDKIIKYYLDHNWDDRVEFGPYINPGGIIEYIVQSVIKLCQAKAA